MLPPTTKPEEEERMVEKYGPPSAFGIEEDLQFPILQTPLDIVERESVPYGPPSVFGIEEPPMLPPTTKPEEEQKPAPVVAYGPPSVFGIGEPPMLPPTTKPKEKRKYGPPSAFVIGKLPTRKPKEERTVDSYGPPSAYGMGILAPEPEENTLPLFPAKPPEEEKLPSPRVLTQYGPPSAFGIGEDLQVPIPQTPLHIETVERETITYGPEESFLDFSVEDTIEDQDEASDEEIPESKLSSASPEKGS